MKKITFLFGVLCSLPAMSQTYTPFPENQAYWSIYHRPDPLQFPNPPNLYTNYLMQGDTIIGAYSYNKIYSRICDCNAPYGCFAPSFSAWQFCAGIRQDIPSKRVYGWMPDVAADTLLYDFNLSVGDTLPQTYTYNSHYANQDDTVFAIDSVSFHGLSYRRLNHTSNYYGNGAALIEGVGNTNGLFEQSIGLFESGYELVEFCDTDSSDCTADIHASLNEQSHERYLKLFPVPAKENIYVVSDGPISIIIIKDLAGRIVRTEEVPGRRSEVKIDISGLSKGIYLLEENNDAVRKLIVE